MPKNAETAAAAAVDSGADPRLTGIASHAVWWRPPGNVIADTDDFLCRVMALNLWDDITYVTQVFGDDAMRRALTNAPAGIFAPATWHYWHYRLGFTDVPELPQRRFQ